jgi:hypothetical protein
MARSFAEAVSQLPTASPPFPYDDMSRREAFVVAREHRMV